MVITPVFLNAQPIAVQNYNEGTTLLSQGDITGAESSFSRAIEYDERYVEAYLQRGLARWYLTRYGESMQDYDRVLQLNNGLAKAYHNRADIKVLLNDHTDAMED